MRVIKLKPKVAILENVPGILAGRAKEYAIGIVERLNKSGYDVQIWQFNSATMGVPQARERIFFIARRRDLNLPKIVFNFDLKPIVFGDIVEQNANFFKPLWPSIVERWPYIERGDQNLKFADQKYRNKQTCNAFFSTGIMYDDTVPGTLTSAGTTVYYDEMRNLTDTEYRRMSSFPSDFDFCGYDVRYVCGMSVPPLMTAHIASEIARQWFS
jgi:DNA (cytosine-5)-methyltransferase 1